MSRCASFWFNPYWTAITRVAPERLAAEQNQRASLGIFRPGTTVIMEREANYIHEPLAAIVHGNIKRNRSFSPDLEICEGGMYRDNWQ